MCGGFFTHLFESGSSVSSSAHLVVAHPDAVVSEAKGDDVVNEGLALVVLGRRCKHLGQQLLQQLEMRQVVEGLYAKS